MRHREIRVEGKRLVERLERVAEVAGRLADGELVAFKRGATLGRNRQPTFIGEFHRRILRGPFPRRLYRGVL